MKSLHDKTYMNQNRAHDQTRSSDEATALTTLIQLIACMYSGVFVYFTARKLEALQLSAPKHNNLPQLYQQTYLITCKVVRSVPKP